MSKFKKNKKEREAPGITTASLPDIVFMLLCFFMVVTKMRDAEVKVKLRMPPANEIKKLDKTSPISYINIGPPTEKYARQLGSAPRIQLNDQFATPADIMAFVEKEKEKVDPMDHPKMQCGMKVDKETKMGIVTEVKTELRRANFRRVRYLANQGGD